MVTFISFVVASIPGVAAWWTGRQLLARRDDPALPERILARATRLFQVMAATVCVLFVVSPHTPRSEERRVGKECRSRSRSCRCNKDGRRLLWRLDVCGWLVW